MDSSCSMNTKDNLPWQDLPYPAKLNKMFNNGFMVDCCFVVGSCSKSAEKIQGHKLIFAMESPVFERMLCGDFKEAKSDTISLPDDDINDFKRLREVLYSSERASLITTFGMDIIGLYKLTEKYLMTSISKMCVDQINLYLQGNTSDCQLALIYAFSKEYNMLRADVENVAQRRGYPLGPHLNTLKPAVFTDYITGSSLKNFNKYRERFKAIEEYLTYNKLIPKFVLDEQKSGGNCVAKMSSKMTEKEKYDLWKKLLSLVNFSLMTLNEFNAGGLGSSVILTWKQKFKIVEFISNKQCHGYCSTPQHLNIF